MQTKYTLGFARAALSLVEFQIRSAKQPSSEIKVSSTFLSGIPSAGCLWAFMNLIRPSIIRNHSPDSCSCFAVIFLCLRLSPSAAIIWDNLFCNLGLLRNFGGLELFPPQVGVGLRLLGLRLLGLLLLLGLVNWAGLPSSPPLVLLVPLVLGIGSSPVRVLKGVLKVGFVGFVGFVFRKMFSSSKSSKLPSVPASFVSLNESSWSNSSCSLHCSPNFSAGVRSSSSSS